MSNIITDKPSGQSVRGLYVGIFLICLSTIVYEISLTRVFSALMYYHFASMAVALAFLGMGLGGALVWLKPSLSGRAALSVFSLVYGLSVLGLYLAGFAVTKFPEAASAVLSSFHQPYYQPFRQSGGGARGAGIPALMGLAAVTMVPFLLAGAVVSGVLSGLSERVNSLYLADMLGAGLGAVAVIFLLGSLGGPGTLLFAAAAGLAAAAAFGVGGKKTGWAGYAAAVLILVPVFLGYAEYSGGLVKFDFVGGRYEPGVLDTRWNSYSRVLVYRGKTAEMQARAWGVSRAYKGPRPEELNIVINDTGYTTMVRNGPGSDLTSLKYDVTNLPFMLKPGGKSLVIGPGGGRDVLSALVFGSKDVTAVEVNPILRDIVQDKFGDFTGRLYSSPGVRLVVDDGRSFLIRDKARYDVIESARVYEWMEATSGAFTLSENYLYTMEAFRDYITHLTDGGMLSVTRFIFEKQAIRIPSLALAAYKELGVDRPEDRIAILKERGLATFLFKRSAFTPAELKSLAEIAAANAFEVVYMPGRPADNDFARFITAPDRAAFAAAYPLELAPSTDDNPFFNFMVKRSEFWAGLGGAKSGGFDNQALVLLRDLLVVMSVLSLVVFVLPLVLFRKGRAAVRAAGRFPLLVFFGAIGTGFMLVEITFLRKFILFLGHPVYSLSVVLFVLLISTGFGSLISGRLSEKGVAKAMWLTPAVALIYAFLPGLVFDLFLASATAVRVAVSVALLFPMGLLLGMMFPAGIRAAGRHGMETDIPWFWAMNGIFSVLGTMFALVFAMSFGFTATLMVGGLMYAVAAVSFRVAQGAFSAAEITGGS